MTRIRTSRSSSSETQNHNSWDTSLSSRSSGYSASSNSSSGSGVNPLSAAVRAIGSCFGSPVKDEFSDGAARPVHQRNPSVVSKSQISERRHSSERRRSGKALYVSEQSLEKESEHKTFTYSDIQKATKNFSPNSKIGQGGFGTVYKGKLSDGTLVAIKRAKKNVHDTRVGVEFQTEIRTMSTIEHLHLVRLYGFLEHEDERIIVMEYVANGTLREHLDCSIGGGDEQQSTSHPSRAGASRVEKAASRCEQAASRCEQGREGGEQVRAGGEQVRAIILKEFFSALI